VQSNGKKEIFYAPILLYVGTNDVRRSRNLDYVMGEVYDFMNTVKAKFPDSKLVLSGVLRSKRVS
jgi:hypothetical protein